MKKHIAIILTMICVLFLAACSKNDTYEIEILIPAGSTEAFVYSDEEISPTSDKITISAGAGIANTEVILKPVEVEQENTYEPTYLAQGKPVKINVEKGAWFKIGVAMQNDSEKGAIAVAVKVEGVEVRIADTVESQEAPPAEPTEPEVGVLLTVENVTSTGLTIKCSQAGRKPTGELITGSWYCIEKWTSENGWEDVEYILKENEVGWNDIGYMISEMGAVELEVDWEWLYGDLPAGKYRIGKEVMDFRKTGDYDTAMYYAEFNIEDKK